MIRIAIPLLALAVSGCNIDTHAQPEVVQAPAQPQASVIAWSEPSAPIVQDGHVEMYY